MAIERIIESLRDRRQRIIDGKINSIPSPFKRFSHDFLGVEQGKYYLLTGGTKSAKTQFGSYLFLYNSLFYAYMHPDQMRLKIFYYNLEESKEDIIKRFMCHILYRFSNKKCEISPIDLASTTKTRVVSEDVLALFETEKYQKLLDFFEKTIEFEDDTNPTGIFKTCLKYMNEHGTTHKTKKTITDEFGDEKDYEIFDYYAPNDPDEYDIVFIDHVSLISPESGMTLKQSIDKLSEYLVLLRNRYRMTPVVIQQQSLDQESLGAYKASRMEPTLATTSDSRYLGRDCNIALGIFSPYRFGIKMYAGYDIATLQDHVRFLNVIINRGGSPGGTIGLLFNGAVNYFEELPHPSKEKFQLEAIYNTQKTKDINFFTWIHDLVDKDYECRRHKKIR